MCQLEHNYLCRFCPLEDKCEEERKYLTEEEREAIRKMEKIGE